jgi:hypothetical protein
MQSRWGHHSRSCRRPAGQSRPRSHGGRNRRSMGCTPENPRPTAPADRTARATELETSRQGRGRRATVATAVRLSSGTRGALGGRGAPRRPQLSSSPPSWRPLRGVSRPLVRKYLQQTCLTPGRTSSVGEDAVPSDLGGPVGDLDLDGHLAAVVLAAIRDDRPESRRDPIDVRSSSPAGFGVQVVHRALADYDVVAGLATPTPTETPARSPSTTAARARRRAGGMVSAELGRPRSTPTPSTRSPFPTTHRPG